MRWVSILSLLVLAACDTTGPIEPPPTEPPPVEPPPVEPPPVEPPPVEPLPTARLVAPFPDLALELHGRGTSIQLNTHFSGGGWANRLSFAVSVIQGVAVEFDLDGTVLSVRPVAEGQSVVRVEARRAQGEIAADTFVVVVDDPCPAPPPTGVAIVFPLIEGQMWAYTLSSYRWMTSELYEYRSSGRVEVEVVEARQCVNDTQTFVVRERKTETMESRWGGGGIWVPGQPVTTERMYHWTVTDTHVSTDAPNLSGRPGAGLAPPPFGHEAPRFVPISALSADGTVNLVAWSAFGPFVQLADGVGPVGYRTTTVFGTAGSASMGWRIAE